MIVDCAIYEDGKRRNGEVELEHAYQERLEAGNFVWIGLYEPTAEEFDSLAREFHLHPLAVEDAIEAHQRPKVEVYGDMVFLVLKTARYVDPEEVIELGELLVFVGNDYLITVRHGEGSALKQVRDDLEHDQAKLKCGPGAVLARDPRPGGGRLRPGDRRPRERHRRSGGRALLRRPLEPGSARLPAPARGARVPPGRRAARRSARPHRRRAVRPGAPGDPQLLPRRQRPPDPRARPARRHARPARVEPSGQPRAGLGASERRRAQDLGLGRHHRRAHDARRDLRHELRAHAGARPGPSATRWC